MASQKKTAAIPQTVDEAIEQGLEEIMINFERMKPDERKRWIRLNSADVTGSSALIRIFPRLDGKMKICFYNPRTGARTRCFVKARSEVGLD